MVLALLLSHTYSILVGMANVSNLSNQDSMSQLPKCVSAAEKGRSGGHQ